MSTLIAVVPWLSRFPQELEWLLMAMLPHDLLEDSHKLQLFHQTLLLGGRNLNQQLIFTCSFYIFAQLRCFGKGNLWNCFRTSFSLQFSRTSWLTGRHFWLVLYSLKRHLHILTLTYYSWLMSFTNILIKYRPWSIFTIIIGHYYKFPPGFSII